MRPFTFILFAILITLICLIATHQQVESFRAGYRIGKLTQKKIRLQNKIYLKQTELAYLRNPANLIKSNKALNLNLKPIQSIKKINKKSFACLIGEDE